MTASNQQQIDEKMKNISLDEKIPVENELSVEDKYMVDCLNQLDNNEINIDKMLPISFYWLLQ